MATPVQIPKLLLENLEELGTKELKRFQWFLVQHQRDGTQLIQKSHLERADVEDTVDKMVQAYGEDAVEITQDILFRMKNCHLACKLVEANARRHEGQQSSENVSSTVSHEECEDFSTQEDLVHTHEGQQSSENVSSTVSHEEECEDFSSEWDFTCAICLDIFTEPVVLQCGHSFCKACVDNLWKAAVIRSCPICKQRSTEITPSINIALKSLSENLKEKRRHKNPPEDHREVPQPRQTLPKPVKEKREAFGKVKQFCEASVKGIKSQSQDAERKIKSDFERLRLFLQEEEAARIAALKQEETKKTLLMQKIEEMSRDMLSLSDTLKDIEHLGADKSFVQNVKTKLERTQSALSDPQLLPRAEINVAEHAEDLQVRVMEKLLRSIKNDLEDDNDDDLYG